MTQVYDSYFQHQRGARLRSPSHEPAIRTATKTTPSQKEQMQENPEFQSSASDSSIRFSSEAGTV